MKFPVKMRTQEAETLLSAAARRVETASTKLGRAESPRDIDDILGDVNRAMIILLEAQRILGKAGMLAVALDDA